MSKVILFYSTRITTLKWGKFAPLLTLLPSVSVHMVQIWRGREVSFFKMTSVAIE